ncbi:hypothetical protein M231_04983 [Tremella mesenterica]|uniref:Uncharacterized protein n=1 Tax=Tremella mesenterica TaxID=5217 RepID=A0A4Q1BJ64_TREME|nr:hypothetical protein M231_04983 [Tremella mesenterica]
MSERKMDDATRALNDILPHIEAYQRVRELVSKSGSATEDEMCVIAFYQGMSKKLRDHLSRVLRSQLTTKFIHITTKSELEASFEKQLKFIEVVSNRVLDQQEEIKGGHGGAMERDAGFL